MQPRADARQERVALADDRAHDPPSLEFVCLRRYGSFHPLMPRPAAVSAVGGGYLVRVISPYVGPIGRAFNVLIDPGDGVVNNLYRAGLAISDVDMVIVTHDHSDHLGALDAILSLRHERRDRGSHSGDPQLEPASHAQDPSGKLDAEGDTSGRMLILGNHSVVNRYSFLSGRGDCTVLHINDASAQRCPQLAARRLVITSLPTEHPDLGKQDSVGFVLELRPEEPEIDAIEDIASPGSALRIAFMSDTAIQGLGAYDERSGRVAITNTRWRHALNSEIVVAHVSDAPSGELRHLADFPHRPRASVAAFDAGILGLRESGRDDEAAELMHALSLIRPHSDDAQSALPLGLLDRGFLATMRPWKHLFLHGLLAVAKEIREIPDQTKRVLVVGELREQLGSFRGTIAREINCHVFDRPPEDDEEIDGAHPAHRPVALTADIGLRIRLNAEGQQVHCSTCALNNDRLATERYHPPETIREVCVKGDHEAMYWNCRKHDPSQRTPAVFVEQMGSYDPFTGGARFHG